MYYLKPYLLPENALCKTLLISITSDVPVKTFQVDIPKHQLYEWNDRNIDFF